MAVTYYSVPRWLRGNSPKFPWTDAWPEASSQSADKKGQFVYLVAGAITISAVTSTLIWGILNQDASGTATTKLEVGVIEVGDILEINYADAFGSTPPVIGNYYDLINTGGQTYLTTTYANPVFVVRKITDTTKKRCEVSIISTCLQAATGKTT